MIVVLLPANSFTVIIASTILSILHLPPTSTSAYLDSLSCRVTQTFVPEGSRPLVALSEMGCHSFPLTLITGHDSTKRCLKGSPIPGILFLTSIAE